MDRAKTESALLHVAAEYVNRESNRRSMITVTQVKLDDRMHKATIFVTVFPELQARAALDFLSRAEDDFREFVKKRIAIHHVPKIAFMQDPNIAGVGEAVPVE